MSWETLTPLAAPSAAPMVSAHVRVLKNGQAKLHLFFSSFLVEELGGPTAAEAMAGTGEDAGKLRLVFGEGPFALRSVHRFARMSLPVPSDGPQRNTNARACAILSKDVGGRELILSLPFQDWADEASRPKPAAASPVALVKPAGAATGGGAGGAPSPVNPLNAADYLRGKGHTVSELAAGRLAVDGETLTRGQVLNLVNSHRAKADLDPLPHAAVA